ncbi:aminotransferase-like domain-containing protein [Solicola gregarius]|uniref:PLP-dependent aminotransferase family protein n=1 Tax=Solicola gregarius TaxID=2908642 RepID=A0AA46TKH0_9ACTN|nr:PLP-dependent aminotransferase family protein [Solicola gregarius]UYM06783.1 PLP-dependent aminotransferase family protein [Solicola gregarius]
MSPIEELVAALGRWSAGRGPLFALLAQRLRRMIDDGELAPGAHLPPDRRLASALSVGRTTVVAAYDLLEQEGRITRRRGSGTWVSQGSTVRRGGVTDVSTPLFLDLLEPSEHHYQLTCAAPSAPPPQVRAAFERMLARPPRDDIGYHPAGDPALREAIAQRYTDRGLATEPDQVMVTTGAQQALSMVAHLLVGPGERVLVEAPTYPGALEVLREAAATLCTVANGPDGLDVNAAVTAMHEVRPRVAYLVASHHNPTGALLGALGRQRIADSAARHDVTVVDDEVLTELGFGGAPPVPLAAYAPEHVVTVGSLSKLVWGGLRVGWVRASASTTRQLSRLKAVHDLGGDAMTQRAMTELFRDLDEIRTHRVAELVHQHDRLCDALTTHLPTWRFARAEGGQTLWVELPAGDAVSFAQHALRHGVVVLAGGSLDASGGSQAYLRLPFVDPAETLEGAVRALADAWRTYSPSKRRLRSPTPLVV